MSTITKSPEKTNFDYVKEYIKLLPQDKQEEANEFVDAIERLDKEKEERIADMEGDIDNLKDEVSDKEEEVRNANSELQELQEEAEYSDLIITNLGPQGDIHWSSDNLSCKSMMEELENAIHRGIPILKIENLLRAL